MKGKKKGEENIVELLPGLRSGKEIDEAVGIEKGWRP